MPVEITRIGDARPYDAPRHQGMTALRLQGEDASAARAVSVGLSHFLPGGGAERSASHIERIYVVISGEITVITPGGEVTLYPLDSCLIPPGEERSVENRTNQPASILVVMPGAGR